jgi:hypothetical protein
MGQRSTKVIFRMKYKPHNDVSRYRRAIDGCRSNISAKGHWISELIFGGRLTPLYGLNVRHARHLRCLRPHHGLRRKVRVLNKKAPLINAVNKKTIFCLGILRACDTATISTLSHSGDAATLSAARGINSLIRFTPAAPQAACNLG